MNSDLIEFGDAPVHECNSSITVAFPICFRSEIVLLAAMQSPAAKIVAMNVSGVQVQRDWSKLRVFRWISGRCKSSTSGWLSKRHMRLASTSRYPQVSNTDSGYKIANISSSVGSILGHNISCEAVWVNHSHLCWCTCRPCRFPRVPCRSRRRTSLTVTGSEAWRCFGNLPCTFRCVANAACAVGASGIMSLKCEVGFYR